jgi:hippurate hydrolase
MTPEQIQKEAERLADQLVEKRRYLHQHPETGFDLTETISFVKASLREMGITPIDCGKAGITATIGGKKKGKVFLLRADMDALSISEQTGLPFASTNGKMHGCGHDLHTAMLLGAAQLLKSHEDELCGTVKLMFQSAEEIFEGQRI